MLDKNTAFSLLRPDHEKMYFSHCWSVSKTPPPAVSHFTRWKTMRHLEAGGVLPARTPWDTQGWSPRTLPDLPHFNTSLTNEPMDFCRSIWWICAGGSPDFLTDCSPELVRQIAFMKFSPKPTKADLRLLGHLVAGFHMIHPRYALVSQQNQCSCYFCSHRRNF